MDSIAIRKRLDELIAAHGEDYSSLSRRLGRNPTYIQQFVKRGVPRRLSEMDRRALAAHFGIAERLLGGPDETASRAVVARPGLVQRAEDYVLIPQLAIGASAGDGAEPGSEAPLAALAFQANWVRTIASGRSEALSVIGVEGDSIRSMLEDSVRRHFHHDRVCAPVPHLSEKALKLIRFGSSVFARQRSPVEFASERADRSNLFSGGAQDFCDEPGRGRLPICACDADHQQVVGGVPIEFASD